MKNLKLKIPLWITWSRIFLTVPVLWLLSFNEYQMNLWASLVFLLASATDYFDGFLARKWNAVSTMGKFMDPIADKILVTCLLTILIPYGKIDPWMVGIIIARDTFIGGIRSVAAADKIIIAAKPAGKWKTAVQMIAIPAVILGSDVEFIPRLHQIGYFALWFSVILSITSGVEYYNAYQNALETQKGELK